MSNTTRVLFDAPGPRARRRHLLIALVGLAGVAAILWWIYQRMVEKDQFAAERWDWLLTSRAWNDYLVPGLIDTVRAAAIAIVLSSVLGLLLALARMSDFRVLRWAAGVFVEFFRAVPVLIMILFVFYFLSSQKLTPSNLTPLIGVVAGLTLYNSSVLCEVIRNGVASLPAGQREAGLSIGLSPAQTRRSILVPQALTAMMPILVSQVIVITKDSALGYIILYPELVTRARQLGSSEAATLPAYVVVAIIFIVLNYGISKLAEWVEGFQRRRGHTAGPVGEADELAQAPAGGGPGSMAASGARTGMGSGT
jgi:glutamate transport system permease protein